ncbi:uncharacterized protein N7484_011600 [Penicillium longicatenatum]|uniref:uncharacterized protein n=1 Tax=Penicillium longicatenatum TaxID=1561947 RepID=UPI002548E957|nr:uncharacterized protein N7484_011600 [Penicillium longicatenatum]KAJ5631500.1 hypothetical protein N7484_011600 [Penicillium longicatenatum]
MGPNGDSLSSNDVQQQITETNTSVADSESSDVYDGVKSQLDTLTGGSSISEIPSKATAVAGETAATIKETVIDKAVPAAGEALQNLGNQIRNLTGEVEETIEEDLDLEKHSEHIDKMDTERLCDFLREKHKSTAPSLQTK